MKSRNSNNTATIAKAQAVPVTGAIQYTIANDK